jgi:hypothetical protein
MTPALVRLDLQQGIPRTTNSRPDRPDQAAAFPAHGLPVVRVKLAWLGEIATTDELVAALAA